MSGRRKNFLPRKVNIEDFSFEIPLLPFSSITIPYSTFNQLQDSGELRQHITEEQTLYVKKLRLLKLEPIPTYSYPKIPDQSTSRQRSTSRQPSSRSSSTHSVRSLLSFISMDSINQTLIDMAGPVQKWAPPSPNTFPEFEEECSNLKKSNDKFVWTMVISDLNQFIELTEKAIAKNSSAIHNASKIKIVRPELITEENVVRTIEEKSRLNRIKNILFELVNLIQNQTAHPDRVLLTCPELDAYGDGDVKDCNKLAKLVWKRQKLKKEIKENQDAIKAVREIVVTKVGIIDEKTKVIKFSIASQEKELDDLKNEIENLYKSIRKGSAQ